MVSAEALPTIRDQPLDDSETRALEVGEEGVEGEIMWGGEGTVERQNRVTEGGKSLGVLLREIRKRGL